MAAFGNPELWSAAFWFSVFSYCIMHCGIFEMIAWEHQCFVCFFNLGRRDDGSVEMVVWGCKCIICGGKNAFFFLAFKKKKKKKKKKEGEGSIK